MNAKKKRRKRRRSEKCIKIWPKVQLNYSDMRVCMCFRVFVCTTHLSIVATKTIFSRETFSTYFLLSFKLFLRTILLVPSTIFWFSFLCCATIEKHTLQPFLIFVHRRSPTTSSPPLHSQSPLSTFRWIWTLWLLFAALLSYFCFFFLLLCCPHQITNKKNGNIVNYICRSFHFF